MSPWRAGWLGCTFLAMGVLACNTKRSSGSPDAGASDAPPTPGRSDGQTLDLLKYSGPITREVLRLDVVDGHLGMSGRVEVPVRDVEGEIRIKAKPTGCSLRQDGLVLGTHLVCRYGNDEDVSIELRCPVYSESREHSQTYRLRRNPRADRAFPVLVDILYSCTYDVPALRDGGKSGSVTP